MTAEKGEENMYDGDKAVISMIQCFKEGMEIDNRTYKCTVIEYQKEKEQVHLLMSSGNITDISLDGVYECRIQTLQGEAVCTGTIKERYENRAGMIMIFQIINGFYETNLK